MSPAPVLVSTDAQNQYPSAVCSFFRTGNVVIVVFSYSIFVYYRYIFFLFYSSKKFTLLQQLSLHRGGSICTNTEIYVWRRGGCCIEFHIEGLDFYY